MAWPLRQGNRNPQSRRQRTAAGTAEHHASLCPRTSRGQATHGRDLGSRGRPADPLTHLVGPALACKAQNSADSRCPWSNGRGRIRGTAFVRPRTVV